MQRFSLGLIPLVLMAVLAACSSSVSSYALIGVPGQFSYTDSANILINGTQCNYVIYRGNGVTPPEVGVPCTLVKDKKDALGNPHAIIQISFNTAKGPQILSLNAAGTNNEDAKAVPDIGIYMPKNWTLATPAPNMTLTSNAPANIYTSMVFHIGGVRCSLDITAAANNTPVHMPCGLTFWSDTSVSVSIPGALVSTQYSNRSWPLNFSRNPQSGNWDLVKVPAGFPTTYTVTSVASGS